MRAPLLAVAALLGLTGLVALLISDAPETPRATPGSTTNLPAPPEDPGTPAAGDRATIAKRPVDTRPDACSITGRIVDETGAALPDSQVTLLPSSAKTVSNAEGLFVLTDVTAHAGVRLRVERDAAATLIRPLTLWPRTTVDLGDLVLRAEARIRGTVQDEAGEPIAAATVRTAHCSTTTNKSGEFELGGLTRGSHFLTATAAGYAQPPQQPVRVRAGQTQDGVVLRLVAARSIAGHVHTEAGRAIAQAAIEVRVPGAHRVFRATSDESGKFTIEPLPPGKIQLVVEHPAFAPFGRVYATDAGTIDITLTPTRTVRGRVLDARTNAPVPIRSVQLLVSHRTEQGPWRAMTEPTVVPEAQAAAGRFAIPFGVHAFVRVVVLSDDHAPVVSQPIWISTDAPEPLLLHATPGQRVRGVLRDGDGHVVPDAEVLVLSPPGEVGLVQTGHPVALARARTDGQGAFATTPVIAGTYTLRTQRTGYLAATRTLHVDAGNTSALELTAPRAGAIHGTLVPDRELTQPVRVSAVPLDKRPDPTHPERNPSALVRDRRFTFESLEPGRYRLRVLGLAKGADQGFAPVTITVTAGDQQFVELTGPK